MKKNPLLEQSLNFATKIIKLQNYLAKEKKESIISKQIIRSATSVGANIAVCLYYNCQYDIVLAIKYEIKADVSVTSNL